MKAPVSVCLIVRNESAQLESCLRSIRPHVEEICIVDTGSEDSTPDIARKYADKFEVFTECNDEQGRIENFALARQRSFSLATRKWVFWVDGDDEVRGMENLAGIVAEREKSCGDAPVQVMFPYEYAHDAQGKVICLHYRERLMSPPDAFKWQNEVHEVITCQRPGLIQTNSDAIVVVHRRDTSRKPTEPGRNLRILKKMYEKYGETDARHLYYLGLEYGNNGDVDNALKTLKRYIELSGWDDEKYMACLKIVDHYMARGAYSDAVFWCLKATSICEKWGEAYFQLAKCYYFMASSGQGDVRRNWERCVHFARHGLSLPRTQTVLFVNPLERDAEIHKYLNVALNNLGDVRGALESVKTGLEAQPGDGSMDHNRKIYERHLAMESTRSALDRLKEIGAMSPESRAAVETILGGGSVSVSSPETPKSVQPSPHMRAMDSLRSMWETLLKHDEVIAACKLLESAPWFLREDPEVARMKSLTSAMSSHMGDPEKYWSIYSSYHADREVMPLPAEVLPAYSQYPRFTAMMELLESLSRGGDVTMLDVGCFDGWLTNRAGLKGVRAWGVDCSESGVKVANETAAKHGTGARHEVARFGLDPVPADFPSKYSVVSLMEIYEHVPDTRALLRQAADLVAEGGSLVVTTPHGSWCRGEQPGYHTKWDDPKPREHVRAPTVSELRADLEAVGFGDCDISVLPVSQADQSVHIPGQATMFAVARMGPPRIRASQSGGLDITVYVGQGVEAWNPETARANGIGGSETAVLEMAPRLARMGHRVTVYGHCITPDGRSIEGSFDGVAYRDASRYSAHTCDLLITSRRPEAVDEVYGVQARARLCWVHDVHCGSALTHARALKIDRFLTLTGWHRDFFLTQYPYVHPSQVVVTRNGIDLNRFRHLPKSRNPHRAVYSSSPDRGMQVAIQVWPRIRQRIPDAELHLYYGFEVWEACSQGNPQQLSLIGSLKKMIADAAPHGVVYHGRVDQRRLARDYMSSGVWAYPTWFSETSCITAMEAQAAGLAIVTSPIAALNETVGPRGTLIPGDWLSKDYQDRFVDAVVSAMESTTNEHRQSLRDHAFESFGWDSLAVDWDRMFQDVLLEVGRDIVPKYVPAR